MAIKRRVLRYSDEYRRAALARLTNETVEGVAKDLTISPTLIRRWKKSMDKPKSAIDRRKYTEEFKQKAVARVNAGETAQKVADELKISSGMLSNWRKGKGLKRKKKNYYVKVADRNRPEVAKGNGSDVGIMRRVHACIGLLRGVRKQADNNDPVHLTALVVLATLEGKM